MDKHDYLLCTDEHGQPVTTETGKLLYFCKNTGGLTILNKPLDNEPHTSHKRSEHENISSCYYNNINNDTYEIKNDRTQNIGNEDKSEANEDRFTHEMTMLDIVQCKFHLLNDKMHSKKKIWNDIALEMQKKDYLVTVGSKSGDKCHQRWRNLEKMYHAHCRYMKSTGTGKKKPPKYFDEMHQLIGEKHSSQPVNLLDSLGDSTAAASDTSNTECKRRETTDNSDDSPDTADTTSQNEKENIDCNLSSQNIFEKIQKSVRPKKPDNIVTVLKELHVENIDIENKRFKQFQELLTEQNELRKKTLQQRDQFLTIMKSFIKLEARKKSKKRKHSSDSSNSS